VYINQRDTQIIVNNLYFFIKWLYMFRTIISPSSGATFNKLYSAIGTRRYVWLRCIHTTPSRQPTLSLSHSLLYMLELTDPPPVTSNIFITVGIGIVKD
jgi:hypothetical protein